MKKWIAWLFAIGMSMTACAEGYMDFDAHYVRYSPSALTDWSTNAYFETEGVLLYASCEAAELSVSVEVMDEGDTLETHLAKRPESAATYATVEDVSVVPSEATALYAAHIRYRYAYRSMPDDVYMVDAYAQQVATGHCWVVTLTVWGDDAEAYRSAIETDFLNESFGIDHRAVSTRRTAYVRDLSEEDAPKITLDFCQLSYNADRTGIVTLEDAQPSAPYALTADTMIWIRALDTPLSRLQRIDGDFEALRAYIRAYRAQYGEDSLFQLRLSEGEIVWMEAIRMPLP